MRKNFTKKMTAAVVSLTMVVGLVAVVPAAVKKGTDVIGTKGWSGYSIHTREDKGTWEDSLKKDGQQFVGVDVTKDSGIDSSKTYGENAKMTATTGNSFTMDIKSSGWSGRWIPTPGKKDENGNQVWECKGNNPWGVTATKIVKIEAGRTYSVSFKIKSNMVGELTKSEKRKDGTTYNVKTGEKNYIKPVHVKFYRNNEKDGDPAIAGTKIKATYKGSSVLKTTKADCTKTKFTVIELDGRADDYTDVTATFTVPGDKIQWKKGTMGIKFAFGSFLFSYPKDNNMKGQIEVKDFKMIAGDIAKQSKMGKVKGAKNALKVSSKKVKGAKSYEYEYCTKKTFVESKTLKGAKAKATITKGIKAKKKYFVRTRAKLAKGYTIWSAPKSVKAK